MSKKNLTVATNNESAEIVAETAAEIKAPVVLPEHGKFIVKVTLDDGTVKFTGHGKDWLVKTEEKAQVYKTLRGAKSWIEKQQYGAKAEIVQV